jgi:integrase
MSWRCKQRADGAVAAGATEALDAGLADRLSVRDDGQDLHVRPPGDRWRKHSLVFTSDIGTPLDPDNVTHRFPRFLKTAGLPRQRFHDLRHACASLMVAKGEPLLVIQEQLGHSQFTLTADTYSHLYDHAKIDSAGRMDKLLRGAR